MQSSLYVIITGASCVREQASASNEFVSKSDKTKRAYSAYLKLIEVEFGDMPLVALKAAGNPRRFQGMARKFRADTA
jgi:hypothetical protein